MNRFIRFFFADPFNLRIKTKSFDDITSSMVSSKDDLGNQPDDFAQTMQRILNKIDDNEKRLANVD